MHPWTILGSVFLPPFDPLSERKIKTLHKTGQLLLSSRAAVPF